jgi:hypothetical protein
LKLRDFLTFHLTKGNSCGTVLPSKNASPIAAFLQQIQVNQASKAEPVSYLESTLAKVYQNKRL